MEKKQVSFFIDEELHTKFKSKCAKEGEYMNTLLENFIIKYVGGKQ
jgi:hypothetical protein